MPITGVVILTEKNQTEDVLLQVKKIDKVSTYGIHKDNYIIAVIEGDSSNELEGIINHILKNIKGVLGLFPAYVNYEEDENDQ